jgi:hypothetical protein
MEPINPRQINIISRHFHENLKSNNMKIIEDEIINKYSIDNLIKTKNKGLISLILDYAILINNTHLINQITPSISMKRDFFKLIIINKHDVKLSTELFIKNIDLETICYKDVELIIENKLNFLLPFLENQFIFADKDGIDYIDVKFKKYYLQNTSKYIEFFKKYNHIKFDMSYDYIIDAGNVLFSGSGVIDDFSVINLNTVINNFPNSLIIIHQRHLKDKSVRDLLIGKKYIATPNNVNDDIFIILAYLHNQVPIITNDNYKDHFIGDNYFHNNINDVLIKYENNKGVFKFDRIRHYTRCVQIVDNIVYIPSNNGFITI